MKKILLVLCLLAVLAVPASAARRFVLCDPLPWLKTNLATPGAYIYDSTYVSIPWTAKEHVEALAASDTTLAFDISQYKFPSRTWATGATDSTSMATLVGFDIRSWAASGTGMSSTAAAATDSAEVIVQFSYNGIDWTTNCALGAATCAWRGLKHASNEIIPAMFYLNRNATADFGPRFWRCIVANIGASSSSRLVRWFQVRPIVWVDD